MLATTAVRKHEQRFSSRVESMRQRMNIWDAVLRFNVTHTTVYRRLQQAILAATVSGLKKYSPGHRQVFTKSKELLVVEMLDRYSDRGVPSFQKDVKEAFRLSWAGC